MARASSLLLLVISHLSLLSLAEDVTGFNPKCPFLPCGILGNISFPFTNLTHAECGLFMVDNCNKSYPQKIQLGKDGTWFYITNIKEDYTIELRDQVGLEHLKNQTCGSFKNFTLSSSPFYSFVIPPSNVTMLKCLATHDDLEYSYKVCNDSGHSIFYYKPTDDSPNPPAQCSVFQPLVTKTQKSVFFHNIYTQAFSLQVNLTTECYECHSIGGLCQSDSKGNFHCSNTTTGGQFQSDRKGSNTRTGNAKGHIIIVAVAITATGIGVSVILALYYKKRLSSVDSMVFWKKKTKSY